MSTLSLNPEAAARRKAAREAPTSTEPVSAPPAITVQAVGGVHELMDTHPSGKALKRQRLKALRAKLKAAWPHLFEQTVPLAVGIKHEIAKHLSPEEAKLLPAVMHSWCSRPAYLKALLADGAMRHDLDGSVSYLSPADVAYARDRLGIST